jgi:CHAT domain-containing protein
MTSWLAGSLLLASAAASCASQEAEDLPDLTPGHSVSVLIAQGTTASLQLDFAGSEAEEIFLDTAAPNVSFRFISSGGADIESGIIVTSGWAAIPLATGGHGRVQLLLSINDSVEGLTGVRVRADQLPISRNTLNAHRRAAEVFASAQSLHRSLRAEDIRLAINQFQKAADEWGGYGDLYGEVVALGGKAESEIELSRYQEALQTLKHALGLDAKSAYVRGWLNHLGARAYLDQWEPQPAKVFALETLRLGQQMNDPALIALARTDLAGAAYWNGDADANQIADQAHAEAIAAGVPETLALERRWRAWLDESDELNTKATGAMSEAEAYFRWAGDLRTALQATGQIAQAINLNGDLYSALAKFLELEPMTRATGNSVDYGILLEDIGVQHLGLGKPRFAEMYFHLAQNAYAAAHFRRGLMLIHGSLCETELHLNETSSALADCKVSVSLAMQIQDPVFIGIAQCQLGLADRHAGRITQAIADFTEAARNSDKGGDLRRESQERIQLGELLEQRGKRREALAEFLKAESLVRDVTDPTSLIEAQFSVAHWYTQNGQYKAANAELQPALGWLETARQMVSDSTLQATYFAADRKCYELAIELRMREFEGNPAGDGDALALELSERSRARGLLDALTARSTVAGRKRGEAQASLIHSNMAVDRAFDRRLKLLAGGSAKPDLEVNSAELMRALSQLERTQEEVHAAASQATTQAPTMSAAEIEQASVVSGATFFEYGLGAERSFLWVIGGGKRKSYILPPRQQLEDMVKRWRALATSQERGEADAHAKLQHLSARLSCALLADAAEVSMAKMIIVPDGGLAMLPFAALPEKGCSGAPGKPLVVGHEITLTPSLSIFLSRKPQAEDSFQGEVAIVADPVFDAADPRAEVLKIRAPKHDSHPVRSLETPAALPRLLNAGYEANAIRETVRKATGTHHVFLAQGFDANVDTVLSPAMQQFRIWHLATHGVYDETMPEFSGLVFSLVRPDGGPRFGFLKAYDIARLNVHPELVVLSACDSAAGENLSGEGVMGLSYSFLRAGASEVVSTLWSIDDAKSSDLMIAFYKELMRNGGNAAAALHQSQLTVMRQPQSSAPYYWAGFELTSLGK